MNYDNLNQNNPESLSQLFDKEIRINKTVYVIDRDFNSEKELIYTFAEMIKKEINQLSVF